VLGLGFQLSVSLVFERKRGGGRTARVRLLGMRQRFFSIYSIFFIRIGSVRFGFTGSTVQNRKPNRTGSFSKNSNRFNRFFFSVQFFRLIFGRFSRLNRFIDFFAHP
jgi:hypothetical protein